MARWFYKWPFGFLKVERRGYGCYVNAYACARKLGFIRCKHALLKSGAVKKYSLVKNRLPRRTMIDIKEVVALIFFCRDMTHRSNWAEHFYNWLYDEVYTEVMDAQIKEPTSLCGKDT